MILGMPGVPHTCLVPRPTFYVVLVRLLSRKIGSAMNGPSLRGQVNVRRVRYVLLKIRVCGVSMRVRMIQDEKIMLQRNTIITDIIIQAALNFSEPPHLTF